MSSEYELVDGRWYVGGNGKKRAGRGPTPLKRAGRGPTLLALLMALVAGLVFGGAVYELLNGSKI